MMEETKDKKPKCAYDNEKKKIARAIRALKRDEELFDHFKAVDRYPHQGQIEDLRVLNSGKVKHIFLQCGRNYGKSTVSAIRATLQCTRIPDHHFYIIAPYRTQADEIYHQSGLLHKLIPREYLKPGEEGFNKTALRWVFKNGSFIKLDGADNMDALRGYKPKELVCDEFQAWKKEAWVAMEPNLLAYDATCIRIGTPPDLPNVFTEQADYVKRRMEEGDPRFYFRRRTTYDNPRIPKQELDNLHKGFVERGEEAIWRREYMAEFVPGGAASVFPMFNERDHIWPITEVLAEINNLPYELQYVTISDPSGSRSAHLMIAFDERKGRLFVLDEIVETDFNRLSCGQLSPRILEKEAIYYPKREDPTRIYDEAAKLFAIEMADLGLFYSPTSKRQNEKSNNISLVRDLMIRKKFVVASHCVETIQDLYHYHTEILPSGKIRIVKIKDDAVDCILYGVAELGLSLGGKRVEKEETRRFHTPASDFLAKEPDELMFNPGFENKIEEDDTEWTIWDYSA